MAKSRRIIIYGKLDWYGRKLVHGIQNYAQTRPDWTLLIGGLAVFDSWTFRRSIDLSGAHGVIVRLNKPAVEQAVAAHIPVVQMGGFRESLDDLPNVDVDQSQIGQLAAEHLLERGLQHFAFYGQRSSIRSPQNKNVIELRCDAFQQHVQQAGFACASYLPSHMPNSSHAWDQRLKRLIRWLDALPKPVGIMAMSDGYGWQVLEACQQAGLTVPDQVAVIGVNNDELISGITNPPLSSVALDPQRAGYEAASMLDQLMAGRSVTPSHVYIPPSGVVTRRSTDVLSVDDPVVSAVMKLIRDRATQPIQVQDLLAAFPLSRRSLERRFQQAIGHSPLQEIQRVRLQQARKLLAETTWPISQVATACGYHSADYFGAVFKQQTGTTPLRYRKLQAAPQACLAQSV